MGNAVMADSIAHLTEIKAWYSAINDTLAEVDLSKLLVYIIDTVDAKAIPYLAAQFDALGYKGMRLAQTEQDQRALLKRAIELHRYKGTEWAIFEALKSIGFTDVKMKKGIAGGYDHWAKFGLDLTNQAMMITDQTLQDIMQMVTEYKRAVCVLVDISITILVEDVLDISDDVAGAYSALIAEDELNLTGTLKYDGTGEYDGTYDHSGDSDIVTITQL